MVYINYAILLYLMLLHVAYPFSRTRSVSSGIPALLSKDKKTIPSAFLFKLDPRKSKSAVNLMKFYEILKRQNQMFVFYDNICR